MQYIPMHKSPFLPYAGYHRAHPNLARIWTNYLRMP